MEEYKSNSNKSKLEKKAEDDIPEKVIKPVAKGTVKKKSKTSKLASEFFNEDIDDVGDYIVTEVAIPAIKDLISSVISNSIDMMLFGQPRSSSVNRGGLTRTPYSSMSRYSTRTSPTSLRQAQVQSRQRTVMRIDDIAFETKEEALDVLAEMIDLIEKYGQCTVGDYFDLAALSSSSDFTDHKFGWENLSTARVIRVGRSFVIDLPKPMAL